VEALDLTNSPELSSRERARSPAKPVPGRGGRALLWVGLVCLCGLLFAPPLLAAQGDGAWRLRITGHQTFLFGESILGGGIRIPWEVVIEFEVQQGRYRLGSGSARGLDRAEAVSHPAGWFDCQQVEGSYLDSNLAMHQTPRVRFAGFPVAGEVRDGRVILQPGYEPPGNYLAVTYRCEAVNPLADNWFAFAERGKQVFGKRQDAETREDGGRLSARVREVASLPPEGALDLPLIDGWRFVQGREAADRQVRFALNRLE
jgi:hypothetical protein